MADNSVLFVCKVTYRADRTPLKLPFTSRREFDKAVNELRSKYGYENVEVEPGYTIYGSAFKAVNMVEFWAH